MAFVITSGCCNDASCVDVCPVDCIRPHPDDPEFLTAEQLYIDPESCIECSACMFACPVSAIHDGFELPEHLADFAALNAEHFVEAPLTARFVGVPAVPAAPSPARVAVVGTGPAGCYAVEELSSVPGVEVTVFDRLPTPFGLLRAGVAPDHPDTKLVGDHFGTVLQRPGVTCHLNVDVGTHITLEEIRAAHHAVIYAGGASSDRRLGIAGESLRGSASAREFVSWYNGHPDAAGMTFDLTGTTAVVLGNGNVALDVARLLTRSAADLAATDIADHAAAALARSDVEEVVIVGRRGPVDAACSFPELLELSRLAGVDVRVPPGDLAVDPDRTLTARQRRKLELFQRLADDGSPATSSRRVTFRFGLEAGEITGATAVDGIRLRATGAPAAPLETIDTGLVLRAVGYAVSPVPGIVFDDRTGTLANRQGRVVDTGGDVVAGLYCVGWAKRGPTGVIGTNRVCSRETVAALVDDLRAGRTPEPTTSPDELTHLIGSRQPELVTWTGWQAIDAHERRAGSADSTPRPRRKIVDLTTMLGVARTQEGP